MIILTLTIICVLHGNGQEYQKAMDRQYDGSWGIDLVGYGRLAAVAKDGQG
jgi:hypothetical protein